MWLHVPTTLLASVPDMAESNLDSEKLSLLEQSAMWKSKYRSAKFWQSAWNKGILTKLLSGLIFPRLTLQNGVEQWISLLLDSRVSLFQSQGRISEKMTRETSGQIQPDLYGGLGHQLSFSKMSPEFLSITSVQSDPNYERWVTRLRKDYFQRQKQAHPTNASESSFWPTARASDNEGGIPSNVELSDGSFSRTNADGVRWGVKLKDATANWTTPLADDTNTRKNKFAQGGTPLSMQASNWPTPNTMDELPPRSEEGTKKLFEGARKGRKAPSNLREFVHEENWPTPTTQETPHEEMELTETGRRKTKDGKDSHSLNLQDVSANWPTVTANSATYSNGERGPNLIEEAKKWPTPNASEHKYRMQGNTQQSNGLTATARKSDIHSTLQDQETETDGHTCSPSCRRLNPLFAEHLMGLPLGWTCVSEPLAMESFQQWQLGLSAYLARS